jgi:hypothetical protein
VAAGEDFRGHGRGNRRDDEGDGHVGSRGERLVQRVS